MSKPEKRVISNQEENEGPTYDYEQENQQDYNQNNLIDFDLPIQKKPDKESIDQPKVIEFTLGQSKHSDHKNQNQQDQENEQEDIFKSIDKPLQMNQARKQKNDTLKEDKQMKLYQKEGMVNQNDFDRQDPWSYFFLQKIELQQLQAEYEDLKNQYQNLQKIELNSLEELEQFRRKKQKAQIKQIQFKQCLTPKQSIYQQEHERQGSTSDNKYNKPQEFQQQKMNFQPQMITHISSTAQLDQQKLEQIISKLGHDLFYDIRELFEYYSAINHPLKCDKMELSSFRRFCFERLGIQKQKQGKMDLEFFKGNKSKSINLIRFIELLMQVSKTRFTWEQDGYLALQLLLNEINKHKDTSLEIMQNYELEDPDVLNIIQENQDKIIQIFEFYEDKDANSQHTLSQQEFLRFAHQFLIIPNLCSQSEVAKIFRYCIMNMPQGTNIPFEEFQNAIFYLALICFGRTHYATRYITAVEKLEAFFHWLDTSSQLIQLEGPLIKEKMEIYDFQLV